MPNQKVEVNFIGKSLALRMSNPLTGDVGHWEYHPICNIISVTGNFYEDFATRDLTTNQRKHRYPHDDMARIVIKTISSSGNNRNDIDFELADLLTGNQPTWTPSEAGVEQAKADINTWIAQCSDPSDGIPAGGYATESTLADQREAVSGGFVFDENNKVWEVRWLYDPNTGTWTKTYYDSFGTVGVPTGDTIFTEENTYQDLNSIQSNIGILTGLISGAEEVDNNPQVSSQFLQQGGKAVDTITYAPAYTAGDAAMLAVDKDNGGLLVNQANLDIEEDDVLVHGGGTDSGRGALSKFRSLTVSDTGQVIKATAGNLYKFNVINREANILYLKFYDKATAPTAADVPVYTVSIDAGIGSHVADNFVIPDRFANGLGVRCVKGVADNDNASPATSPIVEVRYV